MDVVRETVVTDNAIRLLLLLTATTNNAIRMLLLLAAIADNGIGESDIADNTIRLLMLLAFVASSQGCQLIVDYRRRIGYWKRNRHRR